jgi:putative protein kinase ArgK-like GTPase of G3E family
MLALDACSAVRPPLLPLLLMMCCLSVVVNVRIFQGGDDLQMIKRGIMEVADVVLVNKADGATEAAATRAAAEYGGCLRLMPHRWGG